ncbi:hypothetical protein GFO_1548 [Christiangramia forsetii KT0803]|uniref:Uncharacterized protein n=1 Tax=Christiangramia forsetii (strain DSM 17595 / CGMCC 1.15422 / KT0803) TaxID=411154 RepID=A0M1M6_CHRFK|nr:hypothetical protein GFO_1548 [Christiangramia forsetii KT0803]
MMHTEDNTNRKSSDLEFFQSARQGLSKTINIAIAIIIVLALIAMTGVFFEYW